jgi:hypothetical protein
MAASFLLPLRRFLSLLDRWSTIAQKSSQKRQRNRSIPTLASQD